ncbi:hypothetical protein BH24ACT3_BH24ACT3_16490 [soil metagenome]
MRPADTSPEARRVQDEIWRRLTPTERVRIAADMSEDARRVALAGVARRWPELTATEQVAELIRVMYGVDLPVEHTR